VLFGIPRRFSASSKIKYSIFHGRQGGRGRKRSDEAKINCLFFSSLDAFCFGINKKEMFLLLFLCVFRAHVDVGIIKY
jgi:hypothetical protein